MHIPRPPPPHPRAVEWPTWLAACALVVGLPMSQWIAGLPGLQAYPYADEWTYLGVGSRVTDILKWAFALHGDHRIPLQKLLQLGLLHRSQFDFRALVAANLLLATAVAAALLITARNLRGFSSPGDLALPLIVFNPMSGYALWGFHLQFLSTAAALAAFAWALLRPVIACRHLIAAGVVLSASALCGLNGLIVSSALWPVLAWAGRAYLPRPTFGIMLLAIATIIITQWILWRPAPDTGAVASFSLTGRFFAGLLRASLLPMSFDGAAWKAWLLGGLVLTGLGSASIGFLCRRRVADAVLAAMIVIVAALLWAIAAGRSSYQGGWQPTLAMHYGILSLMLPALAWLALSGDLAPRWQRATAGLVLVCIFGLANLEGWRWRAAYTQQASAEKAEAYRAIRSDTLTPAQVSARYAPDFGQTDPASMAQVVRRIPELRSRYALKWPRQARDQGETEALLRR